MASKLGEYSFDKYCDDLKDEWDRFVMNGSVNGTFLNTRRFLEYHPVGRFDDASVLVRNSKEKVIAVVPAASVVDGGRRVFSSHPGSTFGGLIVGKKEYDAEHVLGLVRSLEEWLIGEGFERAVMKQTAQIFCSASCDLLDCCYFIEGWNDWRELSTAIRLADLPDDAVSGFARVRRRGYKNGAENDLAFARLTEDAEIAEFHAILTDNLRKHGATPIHTVDDLLDFKNNRLCDEVEFYGVSHDGELVSAAMMFNFGDKVIHTQNLSTLQDRLELHSGDFLYGNLIPLFKKRGFDWYSFGISTEEHGKILNEGLVKFKEGFGSSYVANRTYWKDF